MCGLLILGWKAERLLPYSSMFWGDIRKNRLFFVARGCFHRARTGFWNTHRRSRAGTHSTSVEQIATITILLPRLLNVYWLVNCWWDHSGPPRGPIVRNPFHRLAGTYWSTNVPKENVHVTESGCDVLMPPALRETRWRCRLLSKWGWNWYFVTGNLI